MVYHDEEWSPWDGKSLPDLHSQAFEVSIGREGGTYEVGVCYVRSVVRVPLKSKVNQTLYHAVSSQAFIMLCCPSGAGMMLPLS